MDKQLVVFPDERKPVGSDSILSLTGGDEISYRELYQPAASAHFYGSLMIASNKPIFIGDTTGLERRLCLVNFDNPIATEKRDHSLEQELDSEIPACIAIALSLTDDAVTQAIQGIGASRIAEYKAKEGEMKVETSSVAAFFDAELVLDPTATTRVGKLYDSYKCFCEEGGLSKFSIVKFPRLLADLLTDENLPATRHQGAQAYFEGLRLRENSDTHLAHSQVLAGIEGVEQGVTGSCEGVDEGVAPLPDKGLRQLRELDPKLSTRSENDDDYLQESEERDERGRFTPLNSLNSLKPSDSRQYNSLTNSPSSATNYLKTPSDPR
jgi:putative DNA primase/helicase